MKSKKTMITSKDPKFKEGYYLKFECPGCKHKHIVDLELWQWNESEEAPTLHPSVLFYYMNPATKQRETICHFFLVDGKLHYLGDCKHDLKGQIIDLPELEEIGGE